MPVSIILNSSLICKIQLKAQYRFTIKSDGYGSPFFWGGHLKNAQSRSWPFGGGRCWNSTLVSSPKYSQNALMQFLAQALVFLEDFPPHQPNKTGSPCQDTKTPALHKPLPQLSSYTSSTHPVTPSLPQLLWGMA
jgi:hypothetical protein